MGNILEGKPAAGFPGPRLNISLRSGAAAGALPSGPFSAALPASDKHKQT